MYDVHSVWCTLLILELSVTKLPKAFLKEKSKIAWRYGHNEINISAWNFTPVHFQCEVASISFPLSSFCYYVNDTQTNPDLGDYLCPSLTKHHCTYESSPDKNMNKEINCSSITIFSVVGPKTAWLQKEKEKKPYLSGELEVSTNIL